MLIIDIQAEIRLQRYFEYRRAVLLHDSTFKWCFQKCVCEPLSARAVSTGCMHSLTRAR